MADRRNGSRGRSSAREAIDYVRRELPDYIGHPVEAVLGVEPDGDNGWKVTAQVVEVARIPSTTDVLGDYEVTLDRQNELTSYRRSRRYYRNQATEE